MRMYTKEELQNKTVKQVKQLLLSRVHPDKHNDSADNITIANGLTKDVNTGMTTVDMIQLILDVQDGLIFVVVEEKQEEKQEDTKTEQTVLDTSILDDVRDMKDKDKSKSQVTGYLMFTYDMTEKLAKLYTKEVFGTGKRMVDVSVLVSTIIKCEIQGMTKKEIADVLISELGYALASAKTITSKLDFVHEYARQRNA